MNHKIPSDEIPQLPINTLLKIEPFIPGVVSALQRAFGVAAESHRPDDGMTAWSFGVNVFETSVHALSRLAEQFPEQMRYERKGNRFRLFIGDLMLIVHKVGKTEHDSMHSKFPKSLSAARFVIEQQSLFSMGDSGLEQCNQLVISTFGNSDEGLCAVYFGIPDSINIDTGRVDGWACATSVWTVGSSVIHSVATYADTPQSEKVGVEEVPEVVVRPKKRKAHDAGV